MNQINHLDPAGVSRNMAVVRDRVAQACTVSGRDLATVELLVATKYLSAEAMGVLAEADVSLVGENRLQDLVVKQDRWGERFTWDFIGHLQSRKVKQVLPRVRMIHSVCSESVIDQVQQHADADIQLLLEVNLSGEQSKSGVAVDQVDRFLEQASQKQRVRFCGLMTMPPYSDDSQHSRPYFAQLRDLAEQLTQQWQPRFTFNHLSMGTSQDYQVAVEEGATIVRLGSIIYT